MNTETKLTTVKIIKGVYSNFKRVSFESDVTLQKLVNRTVERYVTDDDTSLRFPILKKKVILISYE
jgi:hypothetical protein